MPDESPTMTARIMARAAEQDHTTLDTISVKLVSLLILLVGLAIVPWHQYATKSQHAPELYLVVVALVFTILGAAGFMPKALNVAVATIKEVLPGKWKGGGVA